MIGFFAGLCSHILYLRWSQPLPPAWETVNDPAGVEASGTVEGPSGFPVRYAPLTDPGADPPELAVMMAREVEKIRSHAGSAARIRGRVFRVGHAPKSNTYFLNFGPSRESLRAAIFASAVEAFEKKKLSPKKFDGREVEVFGIVKDHPQYGLEVILESPEQIKILK